jgi:hypothetical protein
MQMLLPAMGLLFIGVGRMLRTAKHFIGIRTPWTLASDEVWRATHALGARTFIVGGIVAIAAGFLGEAVLADDGCPDRRGPRPGRLLLPALATIGPPGAHAVTRLVDVG